MRFLMRSCFVLLWLLVGCTSEPTATITPMATPFPGANAPSGQHGGGTCQSVALVEGGADNTATLNAALAALPTNGGCLRFAPGKFYFYSQITFTLANSLSSVSFQGAGSNSTLFYWPNANGGMAFTWSSVQNSMQFSGLTFLTGEAGGGTALALSDEVGQVTVGLNNLYDVTFLGDDFAQGSGSHYWNLGLYSHGVGNLTCGNCIFNGKYDVPGAAAANQVGMVVEGPSPELYATVITLQNCQFNYLGTGFHIGSYVQGVTVNASNFNGETGQYGIYSPADAINLAGLTVTNSQFNTAGYQIKIDAAIPDAIFIGNIITIRTYDGVGLALSHAVGTTAYQIIGNVFNTINSNNRICAVSISGIGGVIYGNTFGNSGQAVYQGVVLQADSSATTLMGNAYVSVVNKYTDLGTGNSIGATP